MSYIEVILLGIIEGITEFLPVSSTAHMILLAKYMGIQDTSGFLETFEIAIQLGAILAILTLYYDKFLQSLSLYWKLGWAFLPIGVVGFTLYKPIKGLLQDPMVASLALILGGVVLVFIDQWTKNRKVLYEKTEEVSYKNAFKVGLFQCLALIPGTSRSAASIVGGMLSGFDRKQAAEFSFLLGVPTMVAATGYDLLKTEAVLDQTQWIQLGIGSLVAFVFAFITVKAFIHYLTKFGFKAFGYYRIVLGVLFIILILTGQVEEFGIE